MSARIVAIDWSGASDGAEQKIWLAEATEDGRIIRLERGRERAAIVEHLINEAASRPDLVVGFDFAFSLPAWFLTSHGLEGAPALWELADRDGEQWLAGCEPPFWGRPARRRPELAEHLRRTDREVPATGGIRPKSVFQIGGAGAVGTASIRGMPVLKQLRRAGFAVWPFDAPRFPFVVEIYPRVLTGVVVKGNEHARRRYLEAKYPGLEANVRENAAGSDDAFDALVSALVMAQHTAELASLSPVTDLERRLEGQIWMPATGRGEPPSRRGLYNSSRTRVGPVFCALEARGTDDPQWVRRLLDLAASGERPPGLWHGQDVAIQTAHYEPNEGPLQAPVSLLSWLIRNFDPPASALEGDDDVTRQRRQLASGDPATIERALDLLRRASSARSWHVLEGATYPDVLLVTPDALVVIEGKRTEAGPTTDTKWLSGRHQMLRHLDGAWEVRGRRSVYGFFIVEAEPNAGTRVPDRWLEAARATRADDAIERSLPHRSPMERTGIRDGFLGVTTWQAIIEAFHLDPALLYETAGSMAGA